MSSVVLFLLLLQSAGALDCKVDEYAKWTLQNKYFRQKGNYGCDGRNELGIETSVSLVDCKQKCVDNTDCVSVEYDLQTRSLGTCQLSSTCFLSKATPATNFDLYYLSDDERRADETCISCATGKSTNSLTGQTTEASCKETTSGTSSPSTTGSTVGTCSSSETKEVQTCINKYQDELKDNPYKPGEACATLQKYMDCYKPCICDVTTAETIASLQDSAEKIDDERCSLVCGKQLTTNDVPDYSAASSLLLEFILLPCCCIFGAMVVWQKRRRQQQRQLLQQRQRQAQQQQQQVMMTQQSGTQQPVIIQSMQQQQQFGGQNSGNMTVPAVPQGQGNVVCVQAVSAVPISQQQQQQQGGMMNYGQPMQPMQPVQPMIYGQQQPGVGPPMVTPMVVTPVVMNQQGGYTGYAPAPMPVPAPTV